MSAPPSSSPVVVAVEPPPAPAPGAPPPVVARGQHQFVVRYYRRMKPQRVYRMVVELVSATSGAGPMAPSDPVTLRPLVPGAHVTPTFGTVAAGGGSKATFYVTPLAHGKLGDARVAVEHQGNTLQEVRTPMKSVTQRFTLFMLLLTVALPWLLYYFTVTTNYASPGVLGIVAASEDDVHKRAPRLRGPIAQAVGQRVPHYDPYLPKTALEDVGIYLQAMYDTVCLSAHREEDYLFHYIVGVFLVLTLLSAFLHRTARATRRGAPLTLPSSASPEPQNPLAFGVTAPMGR